MSTVSLVANLACENPGAGKSFFEGMLGLTVSMDIGAMVTFSSPSDPNVRITFSAADPATPQPQYFVTVDDVEACYLDAQARGCEIVYPLTTEPWGVRRFFVRDPYGYIANILMQPGA